MKVNDRTTQSKLVLAHICRYQNQSSSSSNFEKNRSQAAIRSMALKELEKENKASKSKDPKSSKPKKKTF